MESILSTIINIPQRLFSAIRIYKYRINLSPITKEKVKPDIILSCLRFWVISYIDLGRFRTAALLVIRTLTKTTDEITDAVYE